MYTYIYIYIYIHIYIYTYIYIYYTSYQPIVERTAEEAGFQAHEDVADVAIGDEPCWLLKNEDFFRSYD